MTQVYPQRSESLNKTFIRRRIREQVVRLDRHYHEEAFLRLIIVSFFHKLTALRIALTSLYPAYS